MAALGLNSAEQGELLGFVLQAGDKAMFALPELTQPHNTDEERRAFVSAERAMVAAAEEQSDELDLTAEERKQLEWGEAQLLKKVAEAKQEAA